MWWRRLFPRMWLGFMLVALAALIPSWWVGAQALLMSNQKHNMTDLASVAILFCHFPCADFTNGMEEAERAQYLDFFLGENPSRHARAYVVLLNPEGRVIASPGQPELLGSIPTSPEIVFARSGRRHAERRWNDIYDEWWLYAAAPSPGGGVVVLSESSLRQTPNLSDSYTILQWGAAAALAIAWLAGWWYARWLARPLEALIAGARRLAAGDWETIVPLRGNEEIEALATAFNRMSVELAERFRIINTQRWRREIALAALDEGIITFDSQGLLVTMNRHARLMLAGKHDREETAEADWAKEKETDLSHRDENADGSCLTDMDAPCSSNDLARVPEILGFVKRILAGEAELDEELRVWQHGRERLWEIHGTRLPDESGISDEALLILRDRTRLRRLEVVRRDFIAHVSHELRTPAAAIQGCLATVLEVDSGRRPDAAQARRFLEIALENSMRLNEIVTDMLLLARVEGGEFFERNDESIAPLLAEVSRTLEPLANARERRLIVECPDDLVARIHYRLFDHAMTNLINNAMKYGPKGGIVRVKAFREEKPGDSCEHPGEFIVQIMDDGPGIPAKERERIFDPFYRVQLESGTEAIGGTGLGLPLVRHIARVHGARLTVESAETGGSVFSWRQA